MCLSTSAEPIIQLRKSVKRRSEKTESQRFQTLTLKRTLKKKSNVSLSLKRLNVPPPSNGTDYNFGLARCFKTLLLKRGNRRTETPYFSKSYFLAIM